jgi:hypothetical protein
LRTSRGVGLSVTAATVISLFVMAPAGAQTAAAPVAQAPAAPAPTAGGSPVVADFEGRKIDLARNWDKAQACLVWRQGGVVECFRTDAALEARERELEPQHRQLAAAQAAPAAVAASPAPVADGRMAGDAGGTVTGPAPSLAQSSFSCSSSLDLYEHSYYGGRRLSFWDRGLWQNVGDYGFDNMMSSYIVGACYVYLADYRWGGGDWYPGTTSSYHPEGWLLPGWDNRVSSLYIT